MNIKLPKISVLVPVYKVEPYLQRCIDSVLAQDFQDWEMILVDDGSPDRCPEICDEAAGKDERITVVHKENGGLPSARLAGFERARGDYLVFLDSDDWLLEGALTTLYVAITSDGGYDIVRSIICVIDDKGNTIYQHYPFENDVIENHNVYQKYLYSGKIAPYLHSGIYDKRLFCVNDFIKVVEGRISIGEDWVTNLFISHRVERFLPISKSTYAYFVNSSSYMQSSVMGREYANRVDRCISDYVASASEEVKQLFVLNQVKGIISRDFQKEIPFSMKDYRFVMDYIKDNVNKKRLYSSLSIKYLLFIEYLPLYYIYSRCFSYYKWFKGGMRNRRVLA